MTILFWEKSWRALPYHTGRLSADWQSGYNPKIWGLADGANGWDTNDPHGPYLSGSAASDTTITGRGGTFTTEVTMTPNAFEGWSCGTKTRRHRLTCIRLY